MYRVKLPDGRWVECESVEHLQALVEKWGDPGAPAVGEVREERADGSQTVLYTHGSNEGG